MELRSKSPSGPIENKWDKHRFEMKLVNPANKRTHTVLVVGSGLAGGAAAAAQSPSRRATGGRYPSKIAETVSE